MPKKQSRTDKESEFVNLYRENWGSNAGLSTDKIKGMSERELDLSLGSQRAFAERTRARNRVGFKDGF